MRYGRILAATAIVVGGTALGAGDTRAQEPAVAGEYTLTQVNGKVLPAVTETSNDCREEVTSGKLTVKADSTWQFEYVEVETCGTEVDEDREHEHGRYVMEGEKVRFSADTAEFDPNDVDIEELGVGTPAADGTLSVTLEDGQTVLTFKRSDQG